MARLDTIDTERRFIAKHLNKLVGKTVKAVVRDASGSTPDECYGLEFEDGTISWIMCDPEGNGPGWLGITEPGSKPENN